MPSPAGSERYSIFLSEAYLFLVAHLYLHLHRHCPDPVLIIIPTWRVAMTFEHESFVMSQTVFLQQVSDSTVRILAHGRCQSAETLNPN